MSAANRLKPGNDSDGSYPGPGPQLRDARRAKRMSVEEASRRMKLEVSILEALERDDYSNISAPLYVRGYLTGYARLLDFPEREVLESFRRAQGEGASPVIAAETSLGRQARSSDRSVRWFSYLFGVAILAVATYWGYERWLEDRWVSVAPGASVGSTNEPMDPGPVEAEIPVPARESGPLQQAANTASGDDTRREPLPEAPPSVVTEPTEGRAPAIGGPDLIADDAVDTGPESLTNAAVMPGPDSSATEGAAVVGDQPADALSEALAATSALSAEPAAGSDRLELAFNRDCWLEIRDATGERLAFGLVRSGSVRRYSGTPPFNITLGDSGGVSILFNGRLVKPETYRAADGRPARLVLGAADSPA